MVRWWTHRAISHSSKCSVSKHFHPNIRNIIDRIIHTTTFVTPVVEHKNALGGIDPAYYTMDSCSITDLHPAIGINKEGFFFKI